MPFDIDTTKIFFEKTTQAVDWVVEEIIRQRNWRSILALLGVVLFLAFNPFQWPFPNLFALFPQLEQFRWYKPLFWTLLVAIFVAAVSVAARVKPRTSERVDLKLSAIKGLLPFSYQDADIFERLERTQNLRECLQAISDEHWRLGVLSGESGVGKSSFLQAGLWPEIEKLKLRCVYVKFSDLDPFESVRRACLKHLAPLNPQAGGADGNVNGDANFLNLLHAVIDLNPTPIVLLFDQFEQFFVHRKQKSDRAPFVQALARWFAKEQSLPVKILICIRGDFLDRLNELQKAMAYSLSPMQSFRLERFEPDQATEVFCFLAEKERLDHDRKFITEIMRQEMADSEDGLVSPVNIQVLAWMIVGQRLRSDRAFNRATFQKLGGVDGLLERYLTRALSTRETETRRQAAIKVLLTLVDLERNARAGALTLEALRQKLRGEIRDAELKEVVSWLGRGDVRLIWSSVETDGEKFELAHERLIPALRRLAGKQLSAADRANQLLERRANEWLGSGRHSRYLFSWAELRLIKKQRRFITWGKDRQAKADLLSASRRRFRVQFVATGLIAMLAVIGWAWWDSNQWQSYLIRRDLRDYGGRLNDSNALTEIARGFASTGERQRSLQVIERITDESVKNYALRAVAESFAIGGERAQARRLLVEAIKNVDLVGDGYSKAQTMRAIARLIVKLGDNDGLGALLSDLGEAAKRLPDNCARASVLASLAGASAKLGDTKRMGELFTESIKIVDRTCGDNSKVDALEEIARASAEFGGPQRARAWILAAIGKTDLIIFDLNRGNALKVIAQAIPMLGDQENLNAVFSEVVEKVNRINDIKYMRAAALRELISASLRLGDTKRANGLLSVMGEAVSKITDDSEKNAALADLGVASAMVGEALKDTAWLLKVRAETNTNIDNIFNRQFPLVAIVEALNRLGEASKDRTLLSEAVTTAEMILGEKSKDAKVQAMSMIAESFARFGDKEKARALLLEAVKVAEQSVNTTLGNNGLRALARSVIKIAESPDDRILYDKLFSLYERIKNEDERQILFDSILTSNLVIADIGKMRSLALRYDNEARRSTALAHILMASSHHPELIERTKKSDEEYQ